MEILKGYGNRGIHRLMHMMSLAMINFFLVYVNGFVVVAAAAAAAAVVVVVVVVVVVAESHLSSSSFEMQ